MRAPRTHLRGVRAYDYDFASDSGKNSGASASRLNPRGLSRPPPSTSSKQQLPSAASTGLATAIGFVLESMAEILVPPPVKANLTKTGHSSAGPGSARLATNSPSALKLKSELPGTCLSAASTSCLTMSLRRSYMSAAVHFALCSTQSSGVGSLNMGSHPLATPALHLEAPPGGRADPTPRGRREGASNGAMTYVVRTEGDLSASIPAIQSAVWAAAPDFAFYSVSTVDALLSRPLATRRFTTTLLTLLGVAVLTLAGLGIYG